MDTLPRRRRSTQPEPSTAPVDPPPPPEKPRKVKTRGNGEGTVFKRTRPLKNGTILTTWVGEVMLGYRADGSRDVRRVSAHTEREARSKLDQLRAEVAPWTTHGDWHQYTLRDFLSLWLEGAKPGLKERTFGRYRECIVLHVLPSLGGLKLRALGPDRLQRLYAQLAEDLAPASVRKVHNVLHRALSEAVDWGALSRNPADVIKAPRIPRIELRPPTLSEARAFLDQAAAEDDRLLPLWILAIFTGARQGELLGLTWADVDFDRGSFAIRRTLERIEHAVPVFAETKTATSRRVVALGPEAMAVLRSHKARQAEERLHLGPHYADYDLVFASKLGTPLLRRNVLRSFKLLLERSKLPEYRFHDLRHLSATLMLAGGIHPKVASGRLGHSTVNLTLDVYSHAVEGMDAEAAAQIERAIGTGHNAREAR